MMVMSTLPTTTTASTRGAVDLPLQHNKRIMGSTMTMIMMALQGKCLYLNFVFKEIIYL